MRLSFPDSMKIVVRTSRGLLISNLLWCMALGGFGGFLMIESTKELAVARLLFGLGGGLMIFSAGLCCWAFWSLLNVRPRFIVEEQGVWLPARGVIPWSEISSADAQTSLGPYVYGPVIRLKMVHPLRHGLGPISLNCHGTSANVQAILKLVRERLELAAGSS